MSQVDPNSIIRLYAGIPLDRGYSDTIYFANEATQIAYFADPRQGAIIKTLTANTYQRVNSGVFEARCVADEVYNCNYMAFQNSGFGTKWFYAFVTSIEYVNNGNARITYEIDVLQTYMFDIIRLPCFVEREHTVTDEYGDNLIPEPISPTEFVMQDYKSIQLHNTGTYFNMTWYDVVVGIAEVDGSLSTCSGRMLSKAYCGVDYRAYLANQHGIEHLNAKLGQYMQKPESIVNMYMSPHWLTQGVDNDDNGHAVGGLAQGQDVTPPSLRVETLPMTDYTNSKFGNYTPKNKKLYTYPYNYVRIDTGDGDWKSFRYELFDNLTPKFQIYGSNVPPVQVCIKPLFYKGTDKVGAPLMSDFLTLADFPLCSWNYDTYRAWSAQNTFPMIMQTIASALEVGTGIAGDMPTVGMQGAKDLLSVGNDLYKASIAGDTLKGNIYAGISNYANGMCDFYYCRCHCIEDEARIIDDYFSMYGYACKKVKVPNIDSRPSWNYVRTRGCKILPATPSSTPPNNRRGCPSEAVEKICSIFDSGITWWRNDKDVGDYTQDNSPSA